MSPFKTKNFKRLLSLAGFTFFALISFAASSAPALLTGNKIVLETSKPIGSSLTLEIKWERNETAPTPWIDLNNDQVFQAEEEIKSEKTTSYIIRSQKVTIYGNTTILTCGDLTNPNFDNKLIGLNASSCPSLTRLFCDKNSLTAIDVSGCNLLEVMSCSNNSLKKLSLNTNNKLQILDCSRNKLDTLNLEENKALIRVSCPENRLKALQVEKLTDLMVLYCYENQLETLNLSNCTALQNLGCGTNSIKELDLNNNKDLKILYCYENKLTKLDLSNNTRLNSLGVSNNELTSLDLSNCPEIEFIGCNMNKIESIALGESLYLEEISCYGNKISDAAMTTFINSLPNHAADDEAKLFIIDTKLATEANMCTVDNVNKAKEKCWNVIDYADGANDGMGIPYDGYLAQAKQVTFSTNRKPGSQIALYLEASGPVLIDGVKETYNENTEQYTLEKQNVTITGDINILFISENELTSINVTQVPHLKELYCSDNLLNALDTHANKELSTLRCHNNSLTQLDLTQNTALNELWCSNNKLTSLTLPETNNIGTIYCYKNLLDNLNLSSCNALADLRCFNNNLMEITMPKSKLNTFICFENKLKAIDLQGQTTLRKLDCGHNALNTIDLSQLENIEILDCSYNQLTTLDVSSNSGIMELYCEHNQLDNISINDNEFLYKIHAQSNCISEKNMDSIIESLPLQDGETAASFMVIDTKASNEKNVCTSESVKKAQDKNWNILDFCNGANDNNGINYAGSSTSDIKTVSTDFINIGVADGAISIQGLNVRTLNVFDIQGRKIAQNKMQPGYYIIEIETEEGTKITRKVKI